MMADRANSETVMPSECANSARSGASSLLNRIFRNTFFGDELDIITYGEQLDRGAQFPFDPPRDAVAHGTLTGPFTFGGGDDLQNTSGTLDRGVFGFTAEVESVEEGEQIIEKLTRGGGKVTMPFAQAPWGAHFGVVEDKFGLAWNITTGDGR